MFLILVGLVVVLGLVALVVQGARHLVGRGGGGPDDGSGVRRFFQYFLLFGLLIIVGIGLSSLLGRLLEGPGLVSEDDPALARAITFSVIGIPLYLALAVWSRRRILEDADERWSLGWALYSVIAPLPALTVAMFALYDILEWAFRADRYDATATARLIVWGGLWLAHWLVARPLASQTPAQIHLALGSAIGLGTAVSGLIALLGTAIETLVGAGDGLVVGSGRDLARAGAALATGALVWALYWSWTFARERPTPFWFGYVLPIGVGGGLVTAVAAGATVLHDVLVWFLGDSLRFDAARHFSAAPTAVSAVVVGFLVWWYHRQVLESAESEERTEVRRIYEYLMAAIGLLSAAGGMATVLVAVVEALTGSGAIEVGSASAINTLLAAITLLAVGAPLWWVFWTRIQRAVAADPPEEAGSTTRRIYLLLLFGVGGVVAVIALLVGVFVLIEDLLEGRFGSETWRSMRFALALLVTTGAIAAYHWAVYGQDREAVPAQDRLGPRHILLIGDADDEMARSLARATRSRVELWPRTDGVARPWDLAELVEAVGASESKAVTVISGPGGLQVIGIDRD
ncbi:MAG TPA: DUF5671 domain-containing protein [Acidimicrobiia bacterium]|nr:DUF5671 domain-containing protein [Acidimicrobiia bacterium]